MQHPLDKNENKDYLNIQHTTENLWSETFSERPSVMKRP